MKATTRVTELKQKLNDFELILRASSVVSKEREQQVESIRSQYSEAKRVEDAALDQLAESDSWPAGPVSKHETGLQQQYDDTVNTVVDLKKTADELHAIILKAQKAYPAGSNDDAMDVDTQEGPSSRPLKRRRISKSGRALTPIQPTETEVEGVLDAIGALEGRLLTMNNDMTAHDEDMKVEMSELIEDRFEQLQIERGSLNQHKDKLSIPPDKVLEVEGNVDRLDDEVKEIADELVTLITQSDRMEKEVAAVKKENQQILEDFSSVS